MSGPYFLSVVYGLSRAFAPWTPGGGILVVLFAGVLSVNVCFGRGILGVIVAVFIETIVSIFPTGLP